jgi:SAM-dependent methyltransferase
MGAHPAIPQKTWQLDMFRFSLKKRQKLDLLEAMLHPRPRAHDRCLLITNGDNNGVINYHLRRLGGSWQWAELEPAGIADVEAFLGEPVHAATPASLPFEDGSFQHVVVVDVHEHLYDVSEFNRELTRVIADGGLLVMTTPNGDERMAVARLKRRIGMSKAAYGHVVQGYRPEELEGMARAMGLVPASRGAYARFFTELVELAINYAYVKVLSRRGEGGAAAPGQIAPRTAAQLTSVGRSFRVYRAMFPLIRAFAALDHLVPGGGGYAVAVAARKPAA